MYVLIVGYVYDVRMIVVCVLYVFECVVSDLCMFCVNVCVVVYVYVCVCVL